MQALAAQRDRLDQAFADVLPIPRAGTVEDVANLALFLACDESAYVTGQAVAVDGGLTAGPHWSGHRTRMKALIEAVGGDTKGSRWSSE